MINCCAAFFCEGKVHHVSDVVSLAVGVNLLFPVASSLLKSFLDGLEIEPEKIAARHFDNQAVTSGDLERIAVAAQAIENEKARCSPLAWWWWVLDVGTACLGVLLLLTGWVDHIGMWSLLLFLPAFLAIILAGWRYWSLRRNFFSAIRDVKEQVATRKTSNSAFVKSYVKKCQNAIKRSGKRARQT